MTPDDASPAQGHPEADPRGSGRAAPARGEPPASRGAPPKGRRRGSPLSYAGRGWTLDHQDGPRWLSRLAARSVDHVITDPPYSDYVQRNLPGKTGKSRDGRKRLRDLGYEPFAPKDVRRAAKAIAHAVNRWALVFSDVESAHLWREELTAAGLRYVRTGAWARANPTPQLSGDRPAVGFEAVTICHGASVPLRWRGGGHAALWHHLQSNGHGGHAWRPPHPTPKPVGLLVDLVRLFTDPDETIADPFAGSGSTAVAALRYGRRFKGCELDAEHCRNAARWIAAECSSLSVEDVERGQVPMWDLDP